MTIRCAFEQQVPAVEVDTERADSVDVRNPGAIPLCVAEVHDDEIGIAEWAMLGPHPSAYSENPKPSSVAVAGHYSVDGSLLGGHGRIDQALDIRLGVSVLLGKLRILRRVCRHWAQVRIESSTHSDLDLLRTS